MPGFITWGPSPDLFSIGSFDVRWYGLLFALAFVSAYLVLIRVFPKHGLSVRDLDNLTLFVGIGAIVGARLGHCFFYEPETYLKHPIEILMIRKGGLASHGGALGILLALVFYELKYRKGYLRILDLIAMTVPLAGMFIRLGNLVNSEIIGKASDLPWAFIFTRVDQVPRHPAQLYEAIAYLLMFFILFGLYKRTRIIEMRGLMLSAFLFLVFTFRFFIEFLKEDQVVREATMSLNIGQKLSIPFALLGLAGIILIPLIRQKRTNKST